MNLRFGFDEEGVAMLPFHYGSQMLNGGLRGSTSKALNSLLFQILQQKSIANR